MHPYTHSVYSYSILIPIVFKRFDNDLHKDLALVHVPPVLSFYPFLAASLAGRCQPTDTSYRLRAAVCHKGGGIANGHYYSVVGCWTQPGDPAADHSSGAYDGRQTSGAYDGRQTSGPYDGSQTSAGHGVGGADGNTDDNGGGEWLLFDDMQEPRVQPAPFDLLQKNCLAPDAYILFYERWVRVVPAAPRPPPTPTPTQAYIRTAPTPMDRPAPHTPIGNGTKTAYADTNGTETAYADGTETAYAECAQELGGENGRFYQQAFTQSAHAPMQSAHAPQQQPTYAPMQQSAHTPIQTAHTPIQQAAHTPIRQAAHTPMQQAARTPMQAYSRQQHTPMGAHGQPLPPFASRPREYNREQAADHDLHSSSAGEGGSTVVLIPCEICQQLVPAKALKAHQDECAAHAMTWC
jgi:hypothetical protein